MLLRFTLHLGLAFIFLGNGACSLYQSDARKYLEKNAIEFSSRAAAANLQGCGSERIDESWMRASENESVEVFTNDTLDFTLRIVPRASYGAFNCVYRFASVQEMIERTDSAIELTKEQMALGLVP